MENPIIQAPIIYLSRRNLEALLGRVPARGVSTQPGQAEIHDTQRATAGSRVGAVSQSDCKPSSCM